MLIFVVSKVLLVVQRLSNWLSEAPVNQGFSLFYSLFRNLFISLPYKIEKSNKMNAKDKANQLIQMFASPWMGETSQENLDSAKERAIVCVNEIIDAIKFTTGHCELRTLDAQEVAADISYWNHVKSEIEKFS